METPYKVSILVPIYGVEKYIERCAISLFEQTYENIEYIFVNDCTKDKSIVILKEVIERYPNRKSQVRIIDHEHNKGLGGARNTAVAASTGEFIVHEDSDDYLDVTTIEKMVACQKNGDYDIVTTMGTKVGTSFCEKIAVQDCNDPIKFAEMGIRHTVRNSVWGRLIRRALYIDNNIRVQDGINMSEDLQVMPKLFYYAKTIALLQEYLYYYDCTNIGSYTSSFSKNKVDQQLQTLEMLENFFRDKCPLLFNAVLMRRATLYNDSAINCIKSGEDRSLWNMYKQHYKLMDDIFKVDIPRSKRIVMGINNYYIFKIVVCFLAKGKVLQKKILRHV